MRVIDLIYQGGPFAWPLLFFALLGGIFFVERFIFLHKGQIRAEAFVGGIKNLLKKGRKLEAMTLCQETPGPVARLVQLSLLHSELDEQALFACLRQNALLELPSLEKRIASLQVMAQTAPLIGLMGTIFAFLKGFWALNELGDYASVLSYSPFIVSALAVSFLGLFFATLGHLSFHFLMGRLKSILFDMEWAANEMVVFLMREIKGASQ